MPEYLSGKRKKLGVGIKSYSELTDSLNVIGNIEVNSGDITLEYNHPKIIFNQENGISVSAITLDNNSLEIFNSNPSSEGIKFLTNNTGNYLNAIERLRISPTGNVGIGTTVNFGKLDVNGNVIVSGRVGVNTANPSSDVDLGTIRVRGQLYDYYNSPGVFGYFLASDNQGIKWVAVSPYNPTYIFVSNNSSIVGVSSFIGINIVSEDNILSASTNLANPNFADIVYTPLWLKSGNSGIYTTKNVGIGTTIPTADFQVGFGTTGVTIDGSSGFITAIGYKGFNANIDDITNKNINVSGNLVNVGYGITHVSAYLASAGGITTTGGDLYVAGTLYSNKNIFLNLDVVNLNVSGIASINVGIITNLTSKTGLITNLSSNNFVGIAGTINSFVSLASTIGKLDVNSGVINSISGLAATFNSVKSGSGIITSISGTNLNYTNIVGTSATTTSLTADRITSTNILNSGISTLSGIRITSGIVTGAVGLATFYGRFIGDVDGYVTNAGLASVSLYSILSGVSTYSNISGIATYSASSGVSTYSSFSGIASYSASSGVSTYASVSGLSTYSNTSGLSTLSLGLSGTPNIQVGIVTASEYYGVFKGTIDTGVEIDRAAYARISGIATYALNSGLSTYSSFSGVSTYSNTSGLSTLSLGLSGTPNIQVGIAIASEYYGVFKGTIDTGVEISKAIYSRTSGVSTYSSISGYSTTSGISSLSLGLSGTPNIQVGIVTASEYYGVFKGTIDNGVILEKSNYSNISGVSTYSINSGVSTYASVSGLSTYSNTSGLSTLSLGLSGTPNIQVGIVTASEYYGVFKGTLSGTATIEYAIASGVSTYSSISGYSTTSGISSLSLGLSGTPNIQVGISTANEYYGVFKGTIDNGVILEKSNYSNISGVSTYSLNSGISTFSNISGVSTYSSTSGVSTYSLTSGISSYSNIAGISSYSNTSGLSTLSLGLSGTPNIQVGIVTASDYYGVFKGTIDSNVAVGNASYATTSGISSVTVKLQNSRTFEITGDVAASPIQFDGTGNVSLAATIQPNSVGLGTHTFGNYVKNITGTSNQINVTNGNGEGSSPVISIVTNPILPGNVTVTSDLNVYNNLNVTGNISIGGTTAIIYAQEFIVKDKQIVLGYTTDLNGFEASNDNTANGGGISIASTEGNPLVDFNIVGIHTYPNTYKDIIWVKSGTLGSGTTDAWHFNYAIGIGSTQVPDGIVLAAGNVQISQEDIKSIRNINSSGIITANQFYGQLIGNASFSSYSTTSGISSYANTSGISSYSTSSGISSNVIGGLGSLVGLTVSGITTIANVVISPVGTGATIGSSGIVTYYGDGSQLSGITASRISDSTADGRLLLTSTVDVQKTALGIGSTASIQFSSIGIGTPAISGFNLALANGIIQRRNTVTSIGGSYTIDIQSGNEFVTGATIAGVTTFHLSNLANLPNGYIWRGVLSFAYSSGIVSFFTRNSGYTVKWDGGTVMTPTAGETEKIVIEVVGGTNTIEVAPLKGRT